MATITAARMIRAFIAIKIQPVNLLKAARSQIQKDNQSISRFFKNVFIFYKRKRNLITLSKLSNFFFIKITFLIIKLVRLLLTLYYKIY